MPYDVILAPKWPYFCFFSTIWAVFGHFVHFNMAFTHINLGRGCSTWLIEYFEKSFCPYLLPICPYDIILAPKLPHFCHFLITWTFFGNFDYFHMVFTHINLGWGCSAWMEYFKRNFFQSIFFLSCWATSTNVYMGKKHIKVVKCSKSALIVEKRGYFGAKMTS